MQYQIEHFHDISNNPQEKLTELFAFALENQPPQTRFALDTSAFLRLWAGRDPLGKAVICTARDEQGKLQGIVMTAAIQHPLFITRPFIFRFVEVTKGDSAFAEYVKLVEESL